MFDFKRNNKVIIVAEISANHGQDFRKAVSLIREAKKCGADAVKFQLYTPDTITLNSDNKYFRIRHSKWQGQTLYQLYQKAYTPWRWFKKLKKVSDDLGIEFFATAFDRDSVDLLEGLNVKVHKTASFELVDLPLIEYMAKTQKPLIMSTGMADLKEIKEAFVTAQKGGASTVTLLKCVTSYPADPKTMNLMTIADMRKRFKCPVGLSDHTLGIAVACAAAALGAVMVEKHFTDSRNRKTPDSFFSIEPDELKELVHNVRIIEEAMGKPSYELGDDQRRNRAYRRSLFVAQDIKKGDRFSEENVRSVRPAQGLEPKYSKEVFGKKAKKDIKKGTPLKWELVLK